MKLDGFFQSLIRLQAQQEYPYSYMNPGLFGTENLTKKRSPQLPIDRIFIERFHQGVPEMVRTHLP